MVILIATLSLAYAGGPVQIVTGKDFSCQLDDVGIVSCCDYNEDQQLGLDSEMAWISVPTANGVIQVADLSASGPLTCAASSNGAVTCRGQAEEPAWVKGIAPKRLLGLQDAAEVSVRAAGGCVRHRGGSISCWDNTDGQLNQANRVPNIGFAEQIAVGRAHSCTRVQGGGVWCWATDPCPRPLTPDGPRSWCFNSHRQTISDDRYVTLETSP
ncbi:MAG: hypothetical protein GWP91_12765 [Rhodobacterales bacterium]|nr:hypothetical protein [Rhodobacterales bacterium]